MSKCRDDHFSRMCVFPEKRRNALTKLPFQNACIRPFKTDDFSLEDVSKKGRVGSGRPTPESDMTGPGFYYIYQKPEPARAWLFGLSSQSRSRVLKPGQARKSPSPQYKARPEPAFYWPDPELCFCCRPIPVSSCRRAAASVASRVTRCVRERNAQNEAQSILVAIHSPLFLRGKK
jgi:hypothetical protein